MNLFERIYVQFANKDISKLIALRNKNFIKYFLLVHLTLIFISNVNSQASSYSFSASSSTYNVLTGTTNFGGFSGPTDDENYSNTLTLPFTFNFAGSDYAICRVGSNGWLSFTAANTSYVSNLSSNASSMKPCLFPLWDDLQNGNYPRYGYYRFSAK